MQQKEIVNKTTNAILIFTSNKKNERDVIRTV